MTTVRDAIKIFEESSARNPEKLPAEEATTVKLYFMKPPITKLDAAALSTLKECRHLALSSNNITSMVNLGALENLEILSMGRNNIKKLEHLDAVADHLEQLWMSYNAISSLNGLDKCKNLKILYLGNNKISDIKEVHKLQALPQLEELVLFGNPIHNQIIQDTDLAWPTAILKLLPELKRLDGISTIEWKLKISEGNEKPLRMLFEKIDADGSGDLDMSEMMSALQDDEIRRTIGVGKQRADEVFAKMDLSGEGTVSWDEFKAWFSTSQDLGTLL